jgi:protein tyrosine phosphatase (PTP) superfamily phosphohydrolase (DUF442 family)
MRLAIIRTVLWSLLALFFLLAGATDLNAGDSTKLSSIVRLEVPGIRNAFKVSENLFSGSQPEGDKAFEALSKLGVNTIISVDGSKPDVEAARKHGLRYVHLPFGYDGVPTNRVAELAKAVETSPGAVFVHCHHGVHRGPAAVAIVCEATQNWTTNQAAAWMREAGTASDYAGLYRSVAMFHNPTKAQLAAVKELPDSAKTSSLVEAMVAIDEHYTRLKLSKEARWKAPPGQPDIVPEHEALMLSEQLAELARTQDAASRPKDYQNRLAEATEAARELHQLLGQPTFPATIESTFSKIGSSCSTCHRQYRNK